MLAVVLLFCLAVTSTFACNGCSFLEKKYVLESCSPNSAKYIDVKCTAPSLSKDCKITSNCSFDIKAIKSIAKAKMECVFNGLPLTKEIDNPCEAMEAMKSDEKVQEIMNMYMPNEMFGCPKEPIKQGMQTKEMEIKPEHAKMITSLQGLGSCKITLVDVNGSGEDVCYKGKSAMQCNSLGR